MRETVWTQGWEFPKKSSSLEDGIDGTNGYFRWNSGCSAEQETLGFPFHETKIEANFRNSVLNHSMEEKTTLNSTPWNKNRSILSEFHSVEQK
jgi:hypothetical protein